MMLPTVIVTGGAGFIGSALCRYLVSQGLANVVNVDKLTYAADLSSLESIKNEENYHFEKCDICDMEPMRVIFEKYAPDGIFHLAAESHVDRSIESPDIFIQTNIVGTTNLLKISQEYKEREDKDFRFLMVSTDEVYGSLGAEGLFSEQTAYDPSSPYSASKAAADHLALAWHKTYGLNVVISNCSNNFGAFQHREKLIPKVIQRALEGREIPIYGSGLQIRDWLFVDDHVDALWNIYSRGRAGEKYNVGANNEYTNLAVVKKICALLDWMQPSDLKGGYASLITHVADRPGHDMRYAIDASKLHNELSWRAQKEFDKGLDETVQRHLKCAVLPKERF